MNGVYIVVHYNIPHHIAYMLATIGHSGVIEQLIVISHEPLGMHIVRMFGR